MLAKLLIDSSARYPKQVAVQEKNATITYQELDRLSDSIAIFLLSKGVKKGDRIGIYINKSILAIAALFGIFKAGCVYVPLDINWSAKRCCFIIDDCQIQYLLSSTCYKQRLRGFSLSTYLKEIIFLDTLLSWPKATLKKPSVSKNDLAVILYTSGSTGRPKGVTRSHQAEINDVGRTIKLYKINKSDRYGLYHPLSFSPGVDDTLLMIKCAATICILPEGLSAFVVSLKNSLRQQKITIIRVGPEIIISLSLYGNLQRGDLPDLKKVIIAGSKLPIEYLRACRKALPGVQFFYEYGTTETILISSYQVKKIPHHKQFLPVGRPSPGVKTYILNEKGKLLKEKPGVIGQIYVSSNSLMSGYWNNKHSGLFPNPFSKKQGPLYKTGDLVKIDENKNYVLLGRIDNLLKIRSFRVNLEEVEYALCRHPKIKDAACLGIRDNKQGNRLKAIVVPNQGQELNKDRIKTYCRKHLAHYMVPEIVEVRKSLPKLPSEKLDRSALYKELSCENS